MEFDVAVLQLCSEDWESGARHSTRFHEDVLSALLPVSRTSEGRLALGATPGAIPAITSLLKDPLVYLERIGLLALRLLRNLCAKSSPNQQRAAQANAHRYVVDAIAHRLATKETILHDGTPARPSSAVRRIDESEEPPSSGKLNLPFFTVAVEFLCNFATSNPPNAELVWRLAFPDIFFNILDCQNRAAVSAGAALLHNCIAANPQRASDLVQIWTEASGQGRSIAELLVKKVHVEGDVDDDEDSDDNDESGTGASRDEVFTWSFMVIQRLVAAGLFENVFFTVGPSLNQITSESEYRFSPYQITLLRLLEAATSKGAEDGGRGDFVVDVPAGSFSFLSDLMIMSWKIGDADTFVLVCNIAGSVILLSMDSEDLAHFKVTSTTAAVTALSVLHQQSQCNVNVNDDRPVIALEGVRVAAIRLIALACDRDRAIQDLVRRVNGIVPILSALSYESDTSKNPFLREWAIFAIRNLCCGNQEIADEIAKLELMDVQLNDQLLISAGLEAFIDQTTGRPRLRVKSESA